MRKRYSRYVLVVDNLSNSSPQQAITYEFEAAGRVRDVARDYKARCALIESADAKWAWQKMDGFRMDGRRWKVDWASNLDFEMMGWKWYEGRSPSPPRRGRTRSRSPPITPTDKDRKPDNSRSPSPAHRLRSRSRSRSPTPARSGGSD